MSSDTATIRVPRETRDLLSRHASERGISLSSLIGEYARDISRELAFASERDAERRDAENDAARAEDREWEATLGDGIG